MVPSLSEILNLLRTSDLDTVQNYVRVAYNTKVN